MHKTCDKCGRMIRDGELVEARVLAYYKELASRISYAISSPPLECLDIQHKDCDANASYWEDVIN